MRRQAYILQKNILNFYSKQKKMQKNRQKIYRKYFQYGGHRLNIHKYKELLQTDKMSTQEKNGKGQKRSKFTEE